MFSLITAKQHREFAEGIKNQMDSGLSETLEVLKVDSADVSKLDIYIPGDSILTQSEAMRDIELEEWQKFLEDTTALKKLDFANKRIVLDSLIRRKAAMDKKLSVVGVTGKSSEVQRFLATQSLKLYEKQGKGLLRSFYDTIPVAMFFLLPIFALILKVLYFRKERFSHHLVFSFYYFTYLFTVLSLIFLVNLFWDIPDWIDILIVASTILYLIISLRNFYGNNWFVTIFKSLVLFFSYSVLVLPLAALVLVVISLLIY